MQDLWERLERWVATNTDGDLALRPGASEDTIAAVEEAIGRRLPDDLRTSFAIHDGQEMPSVRWLDGERRIHPLGSILEQWRWDANNTEETEEATPDGRALFCMTHRGRLPLIGVSYWDGDNAYADFAPGPSGRVGQILYRWDIELVVIAESWRAFLEAYVRRLESGELVYVPGVPMYPEAKGRIVPRGADLTYGSDVLASFA